MTVSSKIRIYDLAKELKLDTRRLIEEVRREGVDVSVPSNSVPKQVANRLREKYLPKQIARNERGPEIIHRSLGGLVPKEDLPKQALRPKTGPKLFFRPFIGPLGRNSNSTDVVTTEDNRQTPRKTTSQTPTEHNQSGRKAVSRSLQKRRNTVKSKPMLLYEPLKKVPAKPRHKPLHKKQYICSICATTCSSKPMLRAHMVSTHMN